MQYDWNEIVDRLTKSLRLSAPPVGVSWLADKAALEAIPKVRIHKKNYTPCTIVNHAVQFGWTSAYTRENVVVNYCAGINGMCERDERWHSAEIFNGVWFDSLQAAQAHHKDMYCIDELQYAMVASPLTAGRLPNVDVCVLYTTVSQAFMLLCGWQFHSYEAIPFSFTGESTCSNSWVYTKLTGKPGFALPCFADRKFAGVGEHELRLTFTPKDLVRAIEGVEGLAKNGLRYPIASYSMLTDAADGFPPKYLEF